MNIERISVDSDEYGWLLHVETDEECFDFRLPHDQALVLVGEAAKVREWWAEGESARREWEARRSLDEDERDAYALDDPKSAGFAERYADAADLTRKRGKGE